MRVARGESSGSGKTAGRGGKGQKGRKGANIRPGFEGGQMPMYRRLPKIGFRSRSEISGCNYEIVNLSAFARFAEGTTIEASSLLGESGSKKVGRRVKVLGKGTCPKNLTVKAHAFSQKARELIQAAGGSAVELGKKEASVEGAGK